MTALLITHLLACTPATVGLDDTGDTGTTTEPPDPVPDLTVWDAELYFSYESWTGDCEPELVSELGGPPEDFEIEPQPDRCSYHADRLGGAELEEVSCAGGGRTQAEIGPNGVRAHPTGATASAFHRLAPTFGARSTQHHK